MRNILLFENFNIQKNLDGASISSLSINDDTLSYINNTMNIDLYDIIGAFGIYAINEQPIRFQIIKKFNDIRCFFISENYKVIRYLEIIENEYVMRNVEININNNLRGIGLGTKIFTSQISFCKKINISYIIAQATGKEQNMNGYYTLAKWGFDFLEKSALNKLNKILLKHNLNKVKSLQELMSTDIGKIFWKKHGFTFFAIFKLKKCSFKT